MEKELPIVNCFVIMPFDRDFDDVYTVIKDSVESAQACHQVQCCRLDEVRPAGRIFDRLLKELRASTFCVADLSGSKPNVMWEVGYAMALNKPIVIVAQQKPEGLPFDVHGMECITYNRSYLQETLGRGLQKVVTDTIRALDSANSIPSGAEARTEKEKVVTDTEFQEFKSMVSEMFRELIGPGAPTLIELNHYKKEKLNKKLVSQPRIRGAKLNWLPMFLGRE